MLTWWSGSSDFPILGEELSGGRMGKMERGQAGICRAGPVLGQVFNGDKRVGGVSQEKKAPAPAELC